ncbi:hypothetical protein F2Q69_00059308 [Brassica cretica]|uniref:Uncharacterized protein n=1 Tax=Brassica cretica TaxID=69181 RepID=A0A8S9RRM0_BRACR|nr:hypothetical protein F2Q69_00059308 [Brassica cretica]
MTTNADKDPQTHDGTLVYANADKTPAGNVSTVTANTAILDQMKKMFAPAQKKDGRTRKTRGLSRKTGGNLNGEGQEQSPARNHKSPQRQKT